MNVPTLNSTPGTALLPEPHRRSAARTRCLPAPFAQRLRVVDDSLQLLLRQVEAGLLRDAEDTVQQAIWELQALDRELLAHNERGTA